MPPHTKCCADNPSPYACLRCRLERYLAGNPPLPRPVVFRLVKADPVVAVPAHDIADVSHIVDETPQRPLGKRWRPGDRCIADLVGRLMQSEEHTSELQS